MFALIFAVGTAFAQDGSTEMPATETPAAETPAAETPATDMAGGAASRCAGMADDALKTCEREVAIEKAQNELAQMPDCATKEGDDKTRCDTMKADLERRIVALQDPNAEAGSMGKKGKKAKKAKKSKS